MKKKWMIILIINIFILLLATINMDMFYIIATFLLWLDLFIYALENLKSRGALFAFLISFFTFLIGRELFERLGIHSIQYEFSNNINLFAERLLLISLICVAIGYVFFGKISFKKTRLNKPKMDVKKIQVIQQVSNILFFATYLFLLMQIIDVILYVFQNGYLAFYYEHTSRLPYIIRKMGDMCIVSFWVYLATMPTKKKAKIPIYLYVIYLLTSLGTGGRYTCIAGLLTLFVYMFFRNNKTDTNEKWIEKRKFLIVIVLVPFFLVFMEAIKSLRVGQPISIDIIKNGFTNFFYSQGVSINVIKRGEIYKHLLPQGKFYVFGSTIDFLQGNILSRFLGITHYSQNSIEHALYGNSFAHALSYVTMGSYYLKGHGLGSCYIAEAYHDFGYVGVTICNILYGFFFSKLMRYDKKSIWQFAVSLILLNSFMLAPRGSADGFIATMIDMTTWGTVLIIYFVSNLIYKRNK